MDINIEDMIISEDEIEKIHRGRRKELIDGLVDELKTVKPGFAIRLNETFGKVSKNDRARVSAIIRKHWAEGRSDKPSIYYTQEGVPQVSIRR